MKIKRKFFYTLVVLSTIICIRYLLVPLFEVTHGLIPAAVKVSAVIRQYIEENAGDFPASQAQLESKYYIKKTHSPEGLRYYLRSVSFDPQNPENPKGWNFSKYFEDFTIHYGASTEYIYRSNGKLFDSDSGDQVLLISSPRIESFCEKLSLSLYEAMLKKTKESADPEQ